MRILAIGGGGFQEEGPASAVDDYIVHLAGATNPRICLLATPSGDRPDYIDAFHAAYGARGCVTSHVPFFQRVPQPSAVEPARFASHLRELDVVFVSGGNVRAAIALWREWGVGQQLQAAASRGVLLAGMSAGAMCWFEQALTDTYWEPGYHPVPALGFVAGGCRVHYSDHSAQRGRLHAALAVGAVPPSVAISDGAAVLYEAGAVRRVVTWAPDAYACHVSHDDGAVNEVIYRSESLV